MVNLRRQRSLTTLFRTEEIKSCFGIRITGKHYVSRAMTEKRGRKTVHLHTPTEEIVLYAGGEVKILVMEFQQDRRPPFRKFSQN